MDRRDGVLVDAMGGTNGDLEKLGPKKFRILPEIAGLGSKYHLAACWPTAGKNGCRSRSERRLLEGGRRFTVRKNLAATIRCRNAGPFAFRRREFAGCLDSAQRS